MTRVLALTSLNNSSVLKKAVDSLRREYGPLCEMRKLYFKDYENQACSLEPVAAAVGEADIVLVDVRSDCRLGRELPLLLGGRKDKTVVVLVGSSTDIFALTRMGSFRGDRMFTPGQDREFSIETYIKTKKFSALTQKLGRVLPVGMLGDMSAWITAQQYYSEGGAENLRSMLLMLLKRYAGEKSIGRVEKPQSFPPWILYHPDGAQFTDPDAYRRAMKFDRARQTAALFFHSGMHFDENIPIIEELHRVLDGKVNTLFVASHVEHNMDALNRCCRDIDILVNFQFFRLWGGPYGGDTGVIFDYLHRADVPLVTGLHSFDTDLDVWRESDRGLSPIETALGITLPELDGAIEPLFVGGFERSADPEFGSVKTPAVVPERIEKLGSRVLKRLALRRGPSAEKKLAVITYSYPPGEGNLASAGYLDVFKSLEVFFARLEREGFRVTMPDIPMKDLFLSAGLINTPDYLERAGVRISLETYEGWFRELPESLQQEMIRCWGEPPGDIMVQGGDLLLPVAELGNIVLGVQPSRGVHEDDHGAYHDKTLPPHHQYLAFYRYIERTFGADALVHFGMHGTLEFMKGKDTALSGRCWPDVLIGSLPHLYYYWAGNTSEATIAKRRSYAQCISHASPPMTASGLYDQYAVLEELLSQYEEEQAPETRDMIAESAARLHLPDDPARLRRELYVLKNRLMPAGLHVIDQQLSGDHLVEYLSALLRSDREVPSLAAAVAQRNGFDWRAIQHAREADTVYEQMSRVIRGLLDGACPEWLDPAYAAFVRRVTDRIHGSDECGGLLRALEGRYVTPACGGDPIRDPDVYPTGKSMYAFDPRRVPTAAADARGKKAAAGLIEHYYANHGAYPETVGVVLWGFETMKTGGDTIAQILSLLGVRIVHKKSLWQKELEVIPLEALGRPRVDVLITMCGIFRDTFGSHIDLINRAVALVAGLDEPPEQNFIRRHVCEQPEERRQDIPLRMFGPSPTEYATNLTTLIETGSWDAESELGGAFFESMSYAYDGEGRAQKSPEMLSGLMSSVDMVTQERDSVEYDITDLDHYYEFLGGLSRAVQDKRDGQQADVLVVDQTEGEPEVSELKTALERGTRSRTLNPRWVEGMLKHDFHGAKKVKDRVEYLLGFAATTGSVDSWVFDEVADRLVLDEDMLEKLQKNNPYAAKQMAETLIESEHRGYWDADEERLKKLRNLVLSMESDVE